MIISYSTTMVLTRKLKRETSFTTHSYIVIYYLSLILIFILIPSECVPLNSNNTSSIRNTQQTTTITPGSHQTSDNTGKPAKLSTQPPNNRPPNAANKTRSALGPTTRQLDGNQQVNKTKQKIRGAKQAKANFSHLFREEVDYYPEEEIKNILRQTPDELKNLFNVINTPLDPNMNLTERIAHNYNNDDGNNNNYDESSGNDYREESVCKTSTSYIYPREVNKNNSPLYVPNNQEFMQVVQAEICQRPNEECNYLQNNLPYGMSSSCQQKYSYKKLLYLDPLDKRLATDMFRFPSCCSCYVRYSSFDLRSSAGNPSIKPPTAPNNGSQLAENNSTISDRLPKSFSDENTNFSAIIITEDDKQFEPQPKRKAKALTLDSNKRTSTSPAPLKRTPPSIDDQIFSNNSTTSKPQIPKPARVSKLRNSTHHTVILQEDKVYEPGSENRRK